jgi:hypothetical protein
MHERLQDGDHPEDRDKLAAAEYKKGVEMCNNGLARFMSDMGQRHRNNDSSHSRSQHKTNDRDII